MSQVIPEPKLGPSFDLAFGESIQIGENIRVTLKRIKHEGGEIKIHVQVDTPSFVPVVKTQKPRRGRSIYGD